MIRFDWIAGASEQLVTVNHEVSTEHLANVEHANVEHVAKGKQTELLVIVHHIISDGISMQLLLKELAVCYQSMISGYTEGAASTFVHSMTFNM